MTPQLFINYKLKSVAHLPWRMMTYKALNTFIDDIFAFVIKMPTMYRIGCFRDDIVFFIFLYQRYIYRVREAASQRISSLQLIVLFPLGGSFSRERVWLLRRHVGRGRAQEDLGRRRRSGKGCDVQQQPQSQELQSQEDGLV